MSKTIQNPVPRVKELAAILQWSSLGSDGTHSEAPRAYTSSEEGGVAADVHGDYRSVTIHHQDSASDIQSDVTITLRARFHRSHIYATLTKNDAAWIRTKNPPFC
jgi:hypothetical protein